MKRHWSFVVTDARYLHAVAALILIVGAVLAFMKSDASHFLRVAGADR